MRGSGGIGRGLILIGGVLLVLGGLVAVSAGDAAAISGVWAVVVGMVLVVVAVVERFRYRSELADRSGMAQLDRPPGGEGPHAVRQQPVWGPKIGRAHV